MVTNFEARRFRGRHQAKSLADWCGGITYTAAGETCVSPRELAAGSSKPVADIGDWIIRAADGTCWIDRPGNQDGYCTDCGKPVWWQDEQLVIKSGLRWCFGKDDAHVGMTHHHALPGMAQYIVQARDGQVCHCLVRSGPHIHQIILVSEEQEAGS
jgi:hypothetical protein